MDRLPSMHYILLNKCIDTVARMYYLPDNINNIISRWTSCVQNLQRLAVNSTTLSKDDVLLEASLIKESFITLYAVCARVFTPPSWDHVAVGTLLSYLIEIMGVLEDMVNTRPVDLSTVDSMIERVNKYLDSYDEFKGSEVLFKEIPGKI